MGQARIKKQLGIVSKRERFMRLLRKISTRYDDRQIKRFTEIRGLR